MFKIISSSLKQSEKRLDPISMAIFGLLQLNRPVSPKNQSLKRPLPDTTSTDTPPQKKRGPDIPVASLIAPAPGRPPAAARPLAPTRPIAPAPARPIAPAPARPIAPAPARPIAPAPTRPIAPAPARPIAPARPPTAARPIAPARPPAASDSILSAIYKERNFQKELRELYKSYDAYFTATVAPLLSKIKEKKEEPELDPLKLMLLQQIIYNGRHIDKDVLDIFKNLFIATATYTDKNIRKRLSATFYYLVSKGYNDYLLKILIESMKKNYLIENKKIQKKQFVLPNMFGAKT